LTIPLGDILPLAIGIALSPVPIIAVILMLFSARARTNGPLFLLGWVLGLLVVDVVLLVIADTQDMGTERAPSTVALVIKLVLGLGLLLLAYRNWQKRPRQGEEAPLPEWMAGIDTFTPVKSFGLAAVLSGVNPKNLLLNAAAVQVIAGSGVGGGELVVALVVFLVVASITVAVPVLYYLAGGAGAQKTLDGWKAWLAANNAVVMAVLLLVLGVKLIGDGIGGLIG
jgi:hypothetical protein